MYSVKVYNKKRVNTIDQSGLILFKNNLKNQNEMKYYLDLNQIIQKSGTRHTTKDSATVRPVQKPESKKEMRSRNKFHPVSDKTIVFTKINNEIIDKVEKIDNIPLNPKKIKSK